jgi:hypothetical protein
VGMIKKGWINVRTKTLTQVYRTTVGLLKENGWAKQVRKVVLHYAVLFAIYEMKDKQKHV